VSECFETDIVTNVARVGDNETLNEMLPALEAGGNHASWTIKHGCTPGGKNGRLFVAVLESGRDEVMLVNTSRYACVGEQDYVVFGEDRVAVEHFLEDFKIKVDVISDMDAVLQVL
jgi:hypothetical protein